MLREARLHHCGIGFVWMWVYAMFETPAFYPHREGVGINARHGLPPRHRSRSLCSHSDFGFPVAAPPMRERSAG